MSVVDAPVADEGRPRGQLRRELRLFEALAISVGIMAPTAAMALNGVAPAGLVGRAVPLAFSSRRSPSRSCRTPSYD
jgi:hypothetical protein